MPEGGIKFGQYVLLRRIARGGMAEVFLAQQRGLEGFDRRVAVKRILPHLADAPDFVKMFLGEAKLAAQLTHPNIVHIYDFGKVGNDYFIAMEYVDGVHAGQLFKLCERGQPKPERMPPTLVARLGADAAAALHYAHELRGPNGKPLNLVHRDVSPANLMVSFDGIVKLCDFGIAKAAALSDQLTNPGQVKGKYAYMSPEQTVAAPLDGRSDVFSLAIVLWELLTGKTIVGRNDTVEAMRAIRDGKLEPIESAAPGTPKPLADALKWGLETKREKRATAADLATALEAFIKSSPEIATPMQLAGWLRPRFAREPTGEHPAVGTHIPQTSTPKTGADAGTLMGSQLIAASRSTSHVDDDAETINIGPPSEIASAIAKRAVNVPTPNGRRSPNVIVDQTKLRPQPELRPSDRTIADRPIEADTADDEHSETVQHERPSIPIGPNGPTLVSPPVMTASVPSLVRDPSNRPAHLPQPLHQRSKPTQPPPMVVTAAPMPEPPTVPRPPTRPPTSQPSPPTDPRASVRVRPTPTVQTAKPRATRIALAIAVLVLLMIASFLIALTMRSRGSSEPRRIDAAVPVVTPDAAPPAVDAAVAKPDADTQALLEVQTSPQGAAITINGDKRVAPASFKLPPGTYTIVAELPGYAPEQRDVELHAGEHQVSDIAFMHKLDAPTGYLTVKTTPVSDVFNGSDSLGPTPLTDVALAPGTYMLTFRSVRKGAVTRKVTITAGKTTKLSLDL